MTDAIQKSAENTDPKPRGFDTMFILLSLMIIFMAIAGGAVLVKKANLPTDDNVQEQCLASGGEVVMSEGLLGPSYGCRSADGKITRMESRG